MKLQVGESFGIYMIDSIDDEFFNRFVKRDNHFWKQNKPQTSNKKLNPMLRSIEFDKSGFPCRRTQKLNSAVWVSTFKKKKKDIKFKKKIFVNTKYCREYCK